MPVLIDQLPPDRRGAPRGPQLPRVALERLVSGELSQAAKALGIAISVQRARLGLTQEELAAAIDVTQSAVSAVQRGETGTLSHAEVDRLITVLGLASNPKIRAFASFWFSASTGGRP
jgi:predicted XRE-type DNA-binding protein